MGDFYETHMTHCGPLNDGVCKYGDDDCPACDPPNALLPTEEVEAVARVLAFANGGPMTWRWQDITGFAEMRADILAAMRALAKPDEGVVERPCLVPKTTAALLGEIARIANDYDLRERIDEYEDSIADSFTWRECIEEAARLASLSDNNEGVGG